MAYIGYFESRYGKTYATDKDCIDRFLDGSPCSKCKRDPSEFYFSSARRRYVCKCGATISPLKGTMFYRSRVRPIQWFHAIYLLTMEERVSVPEIARAIDVPITTAYDMEWKIYKRIRASGGKKDYRELIFG